MKGILYLQIPSVLTLASTPAMTQPVFFEQAFTRRWPRI
jgi:hypothetical protein